MQMSEGLLQKVLEYKVNLSVNMEGYGRELKHYFQQTYNASVDLNCSGCIGRAMKRIIKENNI